MQLIDSFYYTSETIAELRIEYLHHDIDLFMIFESDIGFNGHKKQLKAASLKEKFPELSDKIKIIPLENFDVTPIIPDNVATILPLQLVDNQKIIFNQIHAYFKNHINQHDIVHFSLANEIPLIDIMQFIKTNASKLPFPVYPLGDHFYGSSIAYNALTNLFTNHNIFMDYQTIFARQSLYDLRYHKSKTILTKVPNGINIINKNTKISLQKKQHKNIHLIKPLCIKLENFCTLYEFYEHLLCHCAILDLKHLPVPYFKNNIMPHSMYQHYLAADFAQFKENLSYLSHHLQVFNTQCHAYIIETLPTEFYNFGSHIAAQKMAMPQDVLLHKHYTKIYNI